MGHPSFDRARARRRMGEAARPLVILQNVQYYKPDQILQS